MSGLYHWIDLDKPENRYMPDYRIEKPSGEKAKVKTNKEIEEEHLEQRRKETKRLGYLTLSEAQAAVGSVAETLQVGEERRFFLLGGFAPDNMNMIKVSHFRDTMEKFISKMTNFYNEMMETDHGFKVRVRSDEVLTPGGVVVFYDERQNEWLRARVVKKPKDYDIEYQLFTLDTAEILVVRPRMIYYLHKKFAKTPAFAVRTSLPRVQKGAQEWATKNGNERKQQWELDVLRGLLEMVLDRPIRTKFLQKNIIKGAPVWEVELKCLASTAWENGCPTLDEIVMRNTLV